MLHEIKVIALNTSHLEDVNAFINQCVPSQQQNRTNYSFAYSV